MHMADSPIAHQQISDEKMATYQEIMKRGNPVLKDYCGRLRSAINLLHAAKVGVCGGSYGELRRRLFLPAHDQYHMDYRMLGWTPEQRASVDILRNIRVTRKLIASRGYCSIRHYASDLIPYMTDKEADAVRGVNSIEDTIRAGFIHLVLRMASKLKDRCRTVVEGEDLVQEGLLALGDAIYGYETYAIKDTDRTVKFNTFVNWAVFRRMVRILGKANDYGRLASRNHYLLSIYYRALLDGYETEEFCFDAVLLRMRVKDGEETRGINPEEEDTLRLIFSRFLRNEDFQDANGQGGIEDIPDQDGGIDFGLMSLNDLIARAILTADEREILQRFDRGEHGDLAIVRAIRNTKLTDPEYDLILMSSEIRGFQTRWAAKHGVSRMMASKSMVTARHKISRIAGGFN